MRCPCGLSVGAAAFSAVAAARAFMSVLSGLSKPTARSTSIASVLLKAFRPILIRLPALRLQPTTLRWRSMTTTVIRRHAGRSPASNVRSRTPPKCPASATTMQYSAVWAGNARGLRRLDAHGDWLGPSHPGSPVFFPGPRWRRDLTRIEGLPRKWQLHETIPAGHSSSRQ